jgi:hypothetical protein
MHDNSRVQQRSQSDRMALKQEFISEPCVLILTINRYSFDRINVVRV